VEAPDWKAVTNLPELIGSYWWELHVLYVDLASIHLIERVDFCRLFASVIHQRGKLDGYGTARA
jgi:hypothetical protein